MITKKAAGLLGRKVAAATQVRERRKTLVRAVNVLTKKAGIPALVPAAAGLYGAYKGYKHLYPDKKPEQQPGQKPWGSAPTAPASGGAAPSAGGAQSETWRQWLGRQIGGQPKPQQPTKDLELYNPVMRQMLGRMNVNPADMKSRTQAMRDIGAGGAWRAQQHKERMNLIRGMYT